MKSKQVVMEDSNSPPSFNPADYPANVPRLVLLQKEYANINTGASRKSELAKEISKIVVAQYGEPPKRKLVALPISSIVEKNKQLKINKQEQRMAKVAKKQAAADKSKPQPKKPEMTMKEAMEKAVELSRKYKDKKIYVIVAESDGNCGVSFNPNIPNHETHYCYKNGSQIALEKEPENNVTSKTKTEMKKSKEVKKSAAKKQPAKKSAAKKPAKKSATAHKSIEGGKTVSISIKDMRANIKKGYVYRDPQGVIQTEKYLATRARQDYVREGMQEFKPAK